MRRFTLGFIILLVGCTNSEKKDSAPDSSEVAVLSPKDFELQFSAARDAILMDVRKPEELPDGFIKGARNIDFTGADFSKAISGLDKDKPYFVYCKSGKRSASAVSQMKEMGFNNLYTLEGGLNSWKAAGLETVKP